MERGRVMNALYSGVQAILWMGVCTVCALGSVAGLVGLGHGEKQTLRG